MIVRKFGNKNNSAVSPIEEKMPDNKHYELPAEANVMPAMNAVMPAEANIMPAESNVMPWESNVMPAEANIMPLEANVMPMESNIMPIQENIMPIQANIMPAESNVMAAQENVMPAYQKKCPWVDWQQCSYQNNYEDMYPDVYQMIQPRVRQMCSMMDVPGNPDMYPWPSRAAVEGMTDQIYNDMLQLPGVAEMEEENMKDNRQIGMVSPLGYNPYGIGYSPYGYNPYGGAYGGYNPYGRPRILRDLITILLIRQLLGRRGIYNY